MPWFLFQHVWKDSALTFSPHTTVNWVFDWISYWSLVQFCLFLTSTSRGNENDAKLAQRCQHLSRPGNRHFFLHITQEKGIVLESNNCPDCIFRADNTQAKVFINYLLHSRLPSFQRAQLAVLLWSISNFRSTLSHTFLKAWHCMWIGFKKKGNYSYHHTFKADNMLMGHYFIK